MNAVVERRDQVPVESAEPASILSLIERVARDPAVNVDTMERLFAMAERHKAAEAEKAFAVALNAAQTEVGRVGTNADNTQTGSRYATYAKLDSVLRPIYTKHGFALQFGTAEPPQGSQDVVRVTCTVSHSEGHSRQVFIDMPADGKGIKGNSAMTRTHATGAATQYGMRYLLKMIFNVAIADKDDDGNAASAECITESQAADLRALAEEVGADMPRFLKYLGVPEVGRIPASKYKDAVAALEKKRRQA